MIVGLSIDRKWSSFGSLRSKRCFPCGLEAKNEERESKTARNMARVKELSFQFSRSQNGKSRSSVFLCSETNQKRLLRRLQLWKHRFFLKSKILIKLFEFFIWSWIFILTKKVLPLIYLHVSLPDACAKSSLIGYQLPPTPPNPAHHSVHLITFWKNRFFL